MKWFWSPSSKGFFCDAIHGAIPDDAVEISAEEHADLLNGQATGKLIVAGDDGRPTLRDPLPPGFESLASRARAARDALLKKSDWTQIPDAPLAPSQRADWGAYRKALRELPQQDGFPASIQWPEQPA